MMNMDEHLEELEEGFGEDLAKKPAPPPPPPVAQRKWTEAEMIKPPAILTPWLHPQKEKKSRWGAQTEEGARADNLIAAMTGKFYGEANVLKPKPKPAVPAFPKPAASRAPTFPHQKQPFPAMGHQPPFGQQLQMGMMQPSPFPGPPHPRLSHPNYAMSRARGFPGMPPTVGMPPEMGMPQCMPFPVLAPPNPNNSHVPERPREVPPKVFYDSPPQSKRRSRSPPLKRERRSLSRSSSVRSCSPPSPPRGNMTRARARAPVWHETPPKMARERPPRRYSRSRSPPKRRSRTRSPPGRPGSSSPRSRKSRSPHRRRSPPRRSRSRSPFSRGRRSPPQQQSSLDGVPIEEDPEGNELFVKLLLKKLQSIHNRGRVEALHVDIMTMVKKAVDEEALDDIKNRRH